jgi:hypothetical protein
MSGCRDTVRIAEVVARGLQVPQRPLKVVVTEALRGGRQVFYSIETQHAATAVLREFLGRWSIKESSQTLGFEEPPGWSRPAVQRTAPIAMLRYRAIVLGFARVGMRAWRAPQHCWSRHKRLQSLADMVAVLKRESLREALFVWVPTRRLREKVCDAFVTAAQIAA